MSTSGMIYLDNNATTQIDPAAVEVMLPFLTTSYANPSSGYQFAAEARRALEQARGQLADALGCQPSEIVFTSGGTEANNAAINSALQFEPCGKHIVTTAVEHSAVRRHCQELMKRGAEVTFLGVDADGNLDLAELDTSIRPETAIVSVMWANNETGVIFPVEKIAEICRRRRVFLHTDAVQVIGKIPLRLQETSINFLSLSAHKFHGPKGVGALYIRSGTRFLSSLIGGSHESDRRAGTENVASIMGMGKAAEIVARNIGEEQARVGALRDRFEAALLERAPGISINGMRAQRLCNTTNVSFEGIESQAALMLLDRAGICCSAGSACKAGSNESSHVMQAMGVPVHRARGTLRFSFGRFNSQADLERAGEVVPQVIAKLRSLGHPAAAVAAPLAE
jgi:cysteine desulfurase